MASSSDEVLIRGLAGILMVPAEGMDVLAPAADGDIGSGASMGEGAGSYEDPEQGAPYRNLPPQSRER